MRGGMGSQVTFLFNESGIFTPSKSKHNAKNDARLGGARTPAQISEKTAIYSYETAEKYKDVWHQCANFAKQNCGLKDLEKLSAVEVRAYLESRITDGLARATFARECAALSKLENAMNLFSAKRENGKTYNFREVIRVIAKSGDAKKLERADPHRAYTNPTVLLSHLQNPAHLIAGEVQLRGGARINEVSKIKANQMLGLINGNGKIEVKGKGGKVRVLTVPEKTYRAAEKIINENGTFQIDKNKYGRDLRQAALSSGQTASGSHGLRWNFAQARFAEIQKNGKSYEQALVKVSEEMGHQRADITEHYLR